MAVARPPAVPGVTFLSPTAAQSVTGIVTVRGTAPTALSSATISVDGDTTRPCSVRGNKWRVSLNTNSYSSGSHTITVSATDIAANVSSGSITVTFSAGQTIIPGIQLFKLGDTGYTNTTNKSNFSLFVVGQPSDGTSAGTAALSAAGQPTRHLLWGHAVNTGLTDGNGMGVSGAEITANNWWLTKAGATLAYGDGSTYMVNIGNAAYQARFADIVINTILPRFPGADGILVDNIFDAHWAGPSDQYTTNAAYRAAMLSFVQAVGATLQDAGVYFGGNIVANDGAIPGQQQFNGSEWIWWMRQLTPYMDGMAEEFYLRFDGAHPVRTIGQDTAQHAWETWEPVTADVEALGCDHIAWAGGTSAETMVMTYCKASFLLDWDYRSGSAYSHSINMTEYASTNDVWNAAYTLDVGTPQGAKTQPQTGLYKRVYKKGATTYLVLVNANSSGSLTQDSHTLASGEAYIGV